MTGRYVRSTFVEDQREFVEHLQIGKQIGKLLDMPTLFLCIYRAKIDTDEN